MEAAWAGLTVEESNLPCRSAASSVLGRSLAARIGSRPCPDEAIGSSGRATSGIKVPGVLVGGREFSRSLEPHASGQAIHRRSAVSEHRRRPRTEFFADGMADEIITALSRFPSLFVIARNSSFTYKGRAVDVKQVARELGVRYVLEGSVREAGIACDSPGSSSMRRPAETLGGPLRRRPGGRI